MTAAWKLTLIATLRQRELLRGELGAIMGVDAATLARRIAAMGKLLTRRHDGRSKQVFYCLASNQALVDAFLTAAEPRQVAVRGHLARALADKARHIHIMEDDEVFVPKLHRLPVGADPVALPVEFFRAVEWVAVSPPCAHFAPRDAAEVHS